MHHKSTMKAPGSSGQEAAQSPKEKKILYWKAPMDPTYIRKEPGKSPMGMDLVPVYEGEEGGSAGTIKIDPLVRQNMGLRTDSVKSGPLVRKIRAAGMVSYNEKGISSVNTKIAGWIEKLYVDETGQFVKKGQPLLEIYSPDLVSAQKEVLIALKHYQEVKGSPFKEVVEGARALVKASEERLRLWDIKEKELEDLEKQGIVNKRLTIYSPSSGIVTLKKAFLGTHVKPGAELYRVADISSVWVDADLYEYELPWVKAGQEAYVTLDYIPGKRFKGKISYIYPYLEKKTKTVKVRVEVPNKNFTLKPEMYAHVEIESKLDEDSIVIPLEAVIQTGVRNIVFVEIGEGEFISRPVTLGVETGDGRVQVLSGLENKEKIVLSGQFMLDSESSIREAIQKLTAPETGKEKMDMKGMKGSSGGKMKMEMKVMEGSDEGNKKMDMKGMKDMKDMKDMNGMEGMEGMENMENMKEMKDSEESKEKMDMKGMKGMKDMKGMKNMDQMGHSQ